MNFQLRTLLLLLFIPLLSIAQPLAGNYVISASSAAPFNSLPNAIQRLNASGVSGPVVFLLKDATYDVTGMLTINQFPGSSTVNTLTIKPDVSRNVAINAREINNYTALPAVFKINGADNIIIDGSNVVNGTTQNLTLNNSNTIDYVSRSVLWIASDATNGVSNVHIKNTVLQFSTRSQSAKLLVGVFAGSNAEELYSSLAGSMATAVHSNITVSNNKFYNMRQGVIVKGSNLADMRSSQFNIEFNSIGSTTETQKPNVGIQISNVDAYNITDNNITGLSAVGNGDIYNCGIQSEDCSNYNIKRNTIKDVMTAAWLPVHGINIKGINVNGIISENTISNLKGNGTDPGKVAGLVLDLPASTSSNMLVANNIISHIAAASEWQNTSGIFIANGKDIRIYHNTVLLTASSTNQTSANLRIASGLELNVRNNIFVNNSTGGSRYCVYSNVPAAAFSNIDFNNYHSSQRTGYLNGDRATLAQWQIATEKDANSFTVLPVFADNFRINGSNPALDNKGTFLPEVSTDIDGAFRSTATPDVGAEEFGTVACSGNTVWNGTSWSQGAPNATKNVTFNGNYTATSDLHACSLTVSGNATVTIPSGFSIYSNGGVTVNTNAQLILESGANLLQPSTAINSGNIIVKRKTASLIRLDYALWSSPVSGQKLASFSPQTTSNRFYTYNSATDVYNEIATPSTTSFATANAYLIRLPNNHPTTATVWEGTFSGPVNNGDITVAVTPNKFKAVGNPYPSAIDADNFIGANNLASPLYFWRKTNGSTTSCYATYTLAGGTGTGTSGIVNPVTGLSIVPSGIIPVGQGFITKSTDSEISFNNGMRVGNASGTFLRTSEIERNRIWLNLTGANAIFSQTLVSYMTGATKDVDAGIDGLYYNDSATALTTIINSEEYAIQGRQLPFNSADIVKLGFKTATAGTFEISIDNVDGLFANDQQIYLQDNLTGVTHNLSATTYAFTSAVGVFNDRFELKYENLLLGIDDKNMLSNTVLIASNKQSISIAVKNSMIANVRIFDISGRLVSAVSDVNEFKTSIAVPAINQVLIVHVTDADGIVTVKKVII